eukprot:3568535-Rhodomonas_salina.1
MCGADLAYGDMSCAAIKARRLSFTDANASANGEANTGANGANAGVIGANASANGANVGPQPDTPSSSLHPDTSGGTSHGQITRLWLRLSVSVSVSVSVFV